MTIRVALFALLTLFSWVLCPVMGQATPAEEDTTVPAEEKTEEPTTPTVTEPVVWAPRLDAPGSGPAKKVVGMDQTNRFFDMMGSLLLVLGIILLLAWLVQKYLPKRLGALGESKQLKLLQTLPMGQRRFVSLIEADGRRFLIGVTDTQINLIKALDESSFEQALSAIEDPKRVTDLLEDEL